MTEAMKNNIQCFAVASRGNKVSAALLQILYTMRQSVELGLDLYHVYYVLAAAYNQPTTRPIYWWNEAVAVSATKKSQKHGWGAEWEEQCMSLLAGPILPVGSASDPYITRICQQEYKKFIKCYGSRLEPVERYFGGGDWGGDRPQPVEELCG